jgi:hypothetical protein
VEFHANGGTHNMCYYLADGIYPKWATFVKPISSSQGNKTLHSHNAQAAVRKDAEKAFGILQAQFTIVRGSNRFWDQEILWHIMTVVMILHNMIIESKCGQDLDYSFHEFMAKVMRQVRRGGRI